MTSAHPRAIHGKAFLKALAAAGVIGEHDKVTRVVIDAPVSDMVTVHVEEYGDTRLLNVTNALDGIQISREARPDPETCEHLNASLVDGGLAHRLMRCPDCLHEWTERQQS